MKTIPVITIISGVFLFHAHGALLGLYHWYGNVLISGCTLNQNLKDVFFSGLYHIHIGLSLIAITLVAASFIGMRRKLYHATWSRAAFGVSVAVCLFCVLAVT